MLGNKKRQLIADPKVVIEAITEIKAELTSNQVLMQKLTQILKELSPKACDLFLEGLEQAPDKATYLTNWVDFLENILHHSSEALDEMHHTFLKQYPWTFLYTPSFANLVRTLLQPETNKLWPWFILYFEPKLTVSIDQKVFDEQVALFEKFVATCIKFKITNTISAPIAKNSISFHLQGKSYLERCIRVLEQCTQKENQAQLLHLLPSNNLIDQAFSKKLPLICDSFILHQAIHTSSISELMAAFDYSSFKPKALTYLAISSKTNFMDCFNFFNKLDQIKSTKLDQNEKLVLAKTWTQCAPQQINPVPIDSFIYWARKVKEVLGENHYTQLFTLYAQPHVDLNQYITVCQLLIDLADEVDTQTLLTNHAGKLTELVRTLQTKQQECLLKKYPEKSLDSVLADFKNQSEFVKFPLSASEMEQLKNDYVVIQNLGKEFTLMDSKQLAKEAKRCGDALRTTQDASNKLKLIAIIREMMRREFKIYPYNTQILSLLSLINSPQTMKGRIGQIRTGEGKSTIVAMLSAYLGCQGKTVDVITSSRYLAIRDQKKYQDFYTALGITSSHICYDHPEKKHFDGQILYATNYDVEFSILRDIFFQTDLRYTTLNGTLVKRPFEVAIVDEVDNLFIDASLNSARLAISAAEATAWVYEPILKFVQHRGEHPPEDPDTLNQLRAFLTNHQEGQFKQQANQLSEKQLTSWLHSAYQAQYKRNIEKHYVIKPHKKMTSQGEVTVPRVLIVDHKNTGRIMTDSRWSKGGHEFIEVKHGLQPKDESTTLAAISHPAFFSYYQNIYGLTGTIGELQERVEIKKVYNIDTFDVPPHFPSQRKNNVPRCLATRDAYHQALLDTIQAAKKRGQPTLTLFASISDSLEFSEFLGKKEIKHQLLNEVQQEEENYIIDRAGSSGMITIATNIAGRGADIILSQESKKANGLNLVLAFYPANLRVEDQGYGRAGRQGQPGTCSMILHCEDEQIKKLIKNESERLALCADPHFINKLNVLRSQHIAIESAERVFQSQLESIHYGILKQFGEIFEAFSKSLQTIPLDLIADACSQIQKTATLPINSSGSDPRLETLKNQAQHLLNQQIMGVSIHWETSFLPRALEYYLLSIQQKWAQFFSNLEDHEFASAKADFSTYQNALQKKFSEFISTSMRADLENPMNGFILFLNQLLQVNMEPNLSQRPSMTQSNFFAEWYKKIQATTMGSTATKIGLFAPTSMPNTNGQPNSIQLVNQS